MRDRTFLQARLTKVQAQIVAAENALDGIISGAIESYSLDTGQSVTRVTKVNLSVLNDFIASLYNRCTILESRLNGGNTVQVVPRW